MGKLQLSGKRDYTCNVFFGLGAGGLLTAILMAFGVLLPGPAVAASLPDTIDKVRPSIVAIGTYLPSGSPRQRFRGTGFVVDNGHLVVTNYHVLPTDLDTEKNEQLGVFSGRGRTGKFHKAKIMAEDPVRDLAVLYISQPLSALKLAGDKQVREGTEIAFTGFPLGMALGLYPVTHRGIVSAISPMAPPQLGARVLTAKMIRAMRDPYDVLQLDATAYPGNSGSPVYDQHNGEVVGIINSVFVKGNKEAAIQNPSGITYAIPVRFVHELLKQARQ